MGMMTQVTSRRNRTASGWLLSRKLIRPCIMNDAGVSPGCTRAVTKTVGREAKEPAGRAGVVRRDDVHPSCLWGDAWVSRQIAWRQGEASVTRQVCCLPASACGHMFSAKATHQSAQGLPPSRGHAAAPAHSCPAAGAARPPQGTGKAGQPGSAAAGCKCRGKCRQTGRSRGACRRDMKTALRQRHVWPREQGAVQQAGPHHLKSGRCKKSCASHSLRPAFLYAKLLGPKQPDPLRPQHATLQLQGCRVCAGHQSTWLLVFWSLEQRNSWLAYGTGAAHG